MELVIVSHREVFGLRSGKEETFALPQERDRLAVFRSAQTEKAVVENGLNIELSYATEDDSSVKRTMKFEPISPSRRRRCEKRGWARLRATPVGSDLSRDTIGYLLFVGRSYVHEVV